LEFERSERVETRREEGFRGNGKGVGHTELGLLLAINKARHRRECPSKDSGVEGLHTSKVRGWDFGESQLAVLFVLAILLGDVCPGGWRTYAKAALIRGLSS
jgi:hypothetical protein